MKHQAVKSCFYIITQRRDNKELAGFMSFKENPEIPSNTLSGVRCRTSYSLMNEAEKNRNNEFCRLFNGFCSAAAFGSIQVRSVKLQVFHSDAVWMSLMSDSENPAIRYTSVYPVAQVPQQ